MIIELLKNPIAGVYEEVMSHRTDNGSFYVRSLTRAMIGVSIKYEADGKRWYHASISHKKRMPSHEELMETKDNFIGPDRYAVQVYPPKEFHVNIHGHCLHLWHCLDGHPLPEFSKILGSGIREI